jgi:ubiquinone/menaquinone biosynthesis C-methylase UbiE
MSVYEERVLPPLLILACGVRPVSKQREKIVPRATGDVLEVGFGGGANLPFYNPDKVSHVWGLEPSVGMRRRAQKTIRESAIDVDLIDLPGEEIPLDDNSVDTVLVTYTLCTIADTATALAGMRRVLKANGQLLFCEHGRAPDKEVCKWQDRCDPIWQKVAGGCSMKKDIPQILAASGFAVEDDNRMYIPGIRALSYNYWGAATIR